MRPSSKVRGVPRECEISSRMPPAIRVELTAPVIEHLQARMLRDRQVGPQVAGYGDLELS